MGIGEKLRIRDLTTECLPSLARARWPVLRVFVLPYLPQEARPAILRRDGECSWLDTVPRPTLTSSVLDSYQRPRGRARHDTECWTRALYRTSTSLRARQTHVRSGADESIPRT